MKLTKKGLLIIGVVAVLSTGAFFGIRELYLKSKENEDGEGEDGEGEGGGGGGGYGDGDGIIGTIKVGNELFPSGSYAVLRTEAKINDSYLHNPSGKASIWDYVDNVISERHTGSIGKVESILTGQEDGLTWYKVRFNEPIKADLRTHEYGYVRSDVVKK